MPIQRGKGLPTSNFRRPYGSDWLDINFDSLPDQEWVAADDEGLVASDPDHGELLRKIRLQNKLPENVVITFVDKGAF